MRFPSKTQGFSDGIRLQRDSGAYLKKNRIDSILKGESRLIWWLFEGDTVIQLLKR